MRLRLFLNLYFFSSDVDHTDDDDNNDDDDDDVETLSGFVGDEDELGYNIDFLEAEDDDDEEEEEEEYTPSSSSSISIFEGSM